MNRETLSKKPVKFLTLLLTAMLIATASAAVYYGILMKPSIAITGAKVQFTQGDDWPSGSQMGDNGTFVSLSLKAYPNVTVYYEEPVNITNTEAAIHQIRLRPVSISPDNGNSAVSNFTKIAFVLVALNGSSVQKNFNYTTSGDTWAKPSTTGWMNILNNEEFAVRVEITTAPSANAVSVTIEIAVDVKE